MKKNDESIISTGLQLKTKGKLANEAESTQGTGTGGLDKSKYKRLEMPIFVDENPESWVYRAEHYFYIHELNEMEKVKVAVVSFAPDEVDWFQWSNNRKLIETWEELKN